MKTGVYVMYDTENDKWVSGRTKSGFYNTSPYKEDAMLWGESQLEEAKNETLNAKASLVALALEEVPEDGSQKQLMVWAVNWGIKRGNTYFAGFNGRGQKVFVTDPLSAARYGSIHTVNARVQELFEGDSVEVCRIIIHFRNGVEPIDNRFMDAREALSRMEQKEFSAQDVINLINTVPELSDGFAKCGTDEDAQELYVKRNLPAILTLVF